MLKFFKILVKHGLKKNDKWSIHGNLNSYKIP